MLKTKYIALAITLGSIPLQSNAAVFDGASHCSEDVIYKTQAVNNLIASVGDIQALKTKALEKVGSTENGYFLFDPQFSRSDRYFNCSVPLNESIGNFELVINGITEGLNSSNGGCFISRMRKVSDGGQSKWFRYGTGKGFDWIDLSDQSNNSKQFVSYSVDLNNNFESDAILTMKCRTTWQTGSVSIGQIEIK